MTIPFRTVIFLFAFISGIITSYSVFAENTATDVYDRLDGKGPSGKKVDVIEWEGNLEIHGYPKGTLKGLGAKLDDRTKGKKVMVVGYRFDGIPKPFVRRAILGVPFTAQNLKAYSDPTEKDFDKIAVTNQNLTKPWVPYKLDAAPKQWYPDGDERNIDEPSAPMIIGKNPEKNPEKKQEPAENQNSGRKPASTQTREMEESDSSIKSFSW